jgi:1-acyl-sn-glycerol-3-phosphate acyltransferase
MATAKRQSALAAGAARAGGERAKRRSTPLLSAQVEADAAAPARTVKPVIPVASGSDGTAPAKKAPARRAGSSKVATKAATPAPSGAVPRTAPAKKAAPSATTRKVSAPKVAPSPSKVAPAPAPAVAPIPPASGERAKHRPRPVVASSPAPKARRLSGERKVPRPSPRAKRAQDDLVARRLRLANAPTPVGEAAIDPTRRPHPAQTPTPGVTDLVQGIITALRFAAESAGMSAEDIEAKLAAAIAYVRRRIEGDYAVDEFGYDPHFTENVVLPLLRPIYEKWFRIEVRGIENIPAEGGALIVANHSGTIAIDSVMTQVAIHEEHPEHRVMRALGADLVFQTPFLGTYARRTGSTLAANTDAERLFAKGELVGVFPEGFKGVGKPFKERYKLQRFGRGGFVAAALKAQVPIIPTSIVGAEEIAPIIGNMGTVARLFGLPYAPITPTFPLLGPLGLIPLPSKWIIEFGAPIPTDGFGPRADEDPMLVFDLTDQVRETIQQTLYALLMQRKSVFF